MFDRHLSVGSAVGLVLLGTTLSTLANEPQGTRLAEAPRGAFTILAPVGSGSAFSAPGQASARTGFSEVPRVGASPAPSLPVQAPRQEAKAVQPTQAAPPIAAQPAAAENLIAPVAPVQASAEGEDISSGNKVAALAAAAPPVPAPVSSPDIRKTGDDNVKLINSENVLMKEARRRAQASLEEFFKIGSNPPPGTRGFMVKVALRDSGNVENIWVGALERRTRKKAFITVSESFHGRLANEPEIVKGHKAGGRVPFSKSDITDWMYFDGDGRMIGNHTACAAATLDRTGELRRSIAQYRLDCTWTQTVRAD
jgi:uncharacterized protein YegJ (DUF2314 family)